MKEEYEVIKNSVSLKAIDEALRLINLDIAEKGISKRELDWWGQDACWFPHLRFDKAILSLAEYVPEEFKTETLCEPQILLSFPEEYEGVLYSHIDEEPAWANGRKYKSIVGIPLTSFTESNGGVRIFAESGVCTPTLSPGDILLMRPDVPHSRGINRSGEVRYAVYFRWLLDK